MSYRRHINRQKSTRPQVQKIQFLSTGQYLAVVVNENYAVFQLISENSYSKPHPSEFGLLELLHTYSFRFDFYEFMKTKNIQIIPDVKFKKFTDYYVALNFCSKNRKKQIK